MSARTTLFEKIRAATAGVAEKAAYPEYDAGVTVSAPRLEGGDPAESFIRNFTAASGKVMRSAAELAAFLRAGGHTRGYCDPALMAGVGDALAAAGLTVETEYDRTRYEDYRFGVTRATGAIAESGSLILDDARTGDRLAALSPWVHAAVLHPDEIHRSIPDALAALGPSRNVIWVTGPSKTADVEGILIEGVHGPGEQIALIL